MALALGRLCRQCLSAAWLCDQRAEETGHWAIEVTRTSTDVDHVEHSWTLPNFSMEKPSVLPMPIEATMRAFTLCSEV